MRCIKINSVKKFIILTVTIVCSIIVTKIAYAQQKATSGNPIQIGGLDLPDQQFFYSAIYTLIATVALLGCWLILNKIFPKVYARIDSLQDQRIPSLKIQSLELLSAAQITQVLISIVKLLRWVILLAFLYIYIPLVLRLFPETQGIADKVFNHLFSVVTNVVMAILGYVPNLLIITVIIFIIYYTY